MADEKLEKELLKGLVIKEHEPKSGPEVVGENPWCKQLEMVAASMVSEVGYNVVEGSTVVETVQQLLQHTMIQVGLSAHQIAEHAGRVQPTVRDVQRAMEDVGLKVDAVGLRDFAFRPVRAIPDKPQRERPPNPVKLLHMPGPSKGFPSYIPSYFPPAPDTHTFFRTPAPKAPAPDYATSRAELADEEDRTKKALASFYARTSECTFFFDDNSLPFINPKPAGSYLDGLIPNDQHFVEPEVEPEPENKPTWPPNIGVLPKPRQPSPPGLRIKFRKPVIRKKNGKGIEVEPESPSSEEEKERWEITNMDGTRVRIWRSDLIRERKAYEAAEAAAKAAEEEKDKQA